MNRDLEEAINAIRHSAALSSMDHVCCLKASGPHAFEALDLLCSADLFLRDGQMLHTLALLPEGTPFADLYICCDEDEFILLAEGPSADELLAHAKSHLPGELEVELTDLGREHRILSLNGPYAWEVLAGWLGYDVIGLPYLTFFHIEEGTCFRAGKTGEYGYDLLLKKEAAPGVRERLLQCGAPFDLREASLEALDRCALENAFFNVRSGPFPGLTPIELQLQWRVSYRKQYVGSEALCRRRESGPDARMTCVAAPREIGTGDRVYLDDRPIGEVRAAGFSPLRRDWLGRALIETPYAHSGIGRYLAGHGSDTVPLRTLSAPAINNRSLYVDPRNHSYRYRDGDEFPPLVLPEQRCC